MPISKGEIIFDEATHTYTKNGETYISVTKLLKKHGLSPDYSAVNADTLRKAAEKGSLIHGEIEAYIKRGEIGFSSELADFIELCENNHLEPSKSEFIVYNDEYKVAGTVDLAGLTADYKAFIADIKTTSTLHVESLSWQLSIYAFLGEMIINEAYGFHLRPDGKSKIVKVGLHGNKEVAELLKAEQAGRKFEPNKHQVVIPNHAKITKLQEDFEWFTACAKKAEEEIKKYKEFLAQAMSKNGVKKWETDDLIITYVEPTTRTNIDGKRLKEEHPEIIEQYGTVTLVKESVRIKLRAVK